MTPPPPAHHDAGGADELAGRALRSLTWIAPIAVFLAAVAVGLARGVPLAVLVLAAGVLAGVIALFWQSVRTLVGETQLTGADAFALGTPHAEEERKRAVLRALKDLEFERSVGKISEDDYRELVTHYRAEAKRLLRQIDEAGRPRRDRVALLVDERLRAAGLAGGLTEARAAAPAEPAATAEPAAAEPAVAEPAVAEPAAAEPATPAEPPGEAAARLACAGCATENDPDAAFCKKCGKPLIADGGAPSDPPADTEALER